MERKYNIMKFIMVLLVIILVSLIGFLIYDQFYDKDNKDKESNLIDKNNDNFVEDKKIIYDANYNYDVDAESYSTTFNNTYYVKDIKVPYIDIDSSDVKVVNNEIKTIFDDAINNYKKGINDKMTYVDECKYSYFIDDNVLSIVIIYGVGATDVVYSKYYTYNINLKTGRLMSYKDVYTYMNVLDIDNSVKMAITKVMKEKLNNVGNEFDTYNNQSINNYTDAVNNNTLKYFIDNNKKLNIIVTLSIPAGRGQIDQIISLDN